MQVSAAERRQRAKTHTRTHTHTHTHPNATQHNTTEIHALLVMGWYNEKKTTDQYAEEKRRVFSFDLKEESEDECLTERGREFQISDPMY